MKRELLFWPNKALREPVEPVVDFNTEKLNQLVGDMFSTMKQWKGVGLAANQIGVNQMVLIYDCDEAVGYMINPVLLKREGKYKVKEGCLSFPETYVEVERAIHIEVTWRDTEGNSHQQTFDGNAAHCIQHEIDHLDGRTFLNHISGLKRDMINRKIKKFNKKYNLLKEHLGHE